MFCVLKSMVSIFKYIEQIKNICRVQSSSFYNTQCTVFKYVCLFIRFFLKQITSIFHMFCWNFFSVLQSITVELTIKRIFKRHLMCLSLCCVIPTFMECILCTYIYKFKQFNTLFEQRFYSNNTVPPITKSIVFYYILIII